MPSTMRWRYGETNPVMLPVQAETTIEIGDLVYLDGGNLKPASEQADQGSLTGNQQAFHDNFVGVAMQCNNGAAANIRVATTGVFEFSCNPTTFEVGDLFGVNACGAKLLSQEVVRVSQDNQSVGRCAKRQSTESGKVLLDIHARRVA